MLSPLRKLCILSALCIPGAVLPLFAARGGILSGTVYDPRANPIAARVIWQGSDGSAPHYLHTDAKGRFRIVGLKPGLYEVRAEARGMSTEWEHNVLVKDGKDENVTLQLIRAGQAPR